jgi:hypothetical protein
MAKVPAVSRLMPKARDRSSFFMVLLSIFF